MDWATERREPIKVYLELEDHPANTVEKTKIEPINIKPNRDRELTTKIEKVGKRTQKEIDKNRLKEGEKV